MGDTGGGGVEQEAETASRARGRAGLVVLPPPPRRLPPPGPVPPSPELMIDLVAAGATVRLGELLGRHTSFRIGGPADVFIEVASVSELGGILRACARHAAPVFFLGGGPISS